MRSRSSRIITERIWLTDILTVSHFPFFDRLTGELKSQRAPVLFQEREVHRYPERRLTVDGRRGEC